MFLQLLTVAERLLAFRYCISQLLENNEKTGEC